MSYIGLCSDIPMAQYIINMNASLPASDKFIIHILDNTHMFVQPHVEQMIRSQIAKFREDNTYVKPNWLLWPFCPPRMATVNNILEHFVLIGSWSLLRPFLCIQSSRSSHGKMKCDLLLIVFPFWNAKGQYSQATLTEGSQNAKGI